MAEDRARQIGRCVKGDGGRATTHSPFPIPHSSSPSYPAYRRRSCLGVLRYFSGLKRMRLGLAPSSPSRFLLSASYS